jgi:hypothetical protein
MPFLVDSLACSVEDGKAESNRHRAMMRFVRSWCGEAVWRLVDVGIIGQCRWRENNIIEMWDKEMLGCAHVVELL